VRIATSSV
jgi:hypothetical protein